jgi:serine/threonine protein kinase
LRLVHDLDDGNMAFDGVIGPIHGDLHPKNIVLDRAGRPRVIDFGWARERGHVLIDYLLMEINLRAMTLPAQVSHDDVLALARMLAEGDDAPTGTELIAARAGWIREVLWIKARAAGVVQDWTAEYLVPQFLIAFGLLKFLDDAKNQVSLLCTVLSLAERIRNTWRSATPKGVSR